MVTAKTKQRMASNNRNKGDDNIPLALTPTYTSPQIFQKTWSGVTITAADAAVPSGERVAKDS